MVYKRCYRRLSFELVADIWMIRKDEASFLVAMSLPTSGVDQCNVGMRLNYSSAIIAVGNLDE